jgi:transposase
VILVPRAVRVYFATQPTNLRKSFDGLVNEIRHTLGYDPLGGHVFVFLNRRKNQVKLIVWTRGGFTIVHKRLEGGTFTFPSRVTGDATSIAIDVHELAMLLEGIDARPRASMTSRRTTRSRSARRDRLVSPPTGPLRRRTRAGSITRCSCPRRNVRVLTAGPSARASAMTSPR